MRRGSTARSLSLGTLLLLALVPLLWTDSAYTAAEDPGDAAPPGPPEYVKEWGGLGDGPGELFMPWGIAIDKQDRVFVSDYGNNRVQVFDPEGAWLGGWGRLGGREGEFRGPVGIAVGPQGNVYVADAFNYRVQVFTPEGEFVRGWRGPAAQGAGAGRPFTPWGIAVGPDGSVYVTDLHANRVYKFSREGELLLSWGGFGTREGQFTGPTGIAVLGDRVYVVDSLGYRIQVFTPDGEYLFQWGSFCDLYIHPGRGCRDPDGPGPLESGDGQLSSPWGIAFDAQKRVYVADSANKRIQVFTPEGDFLLKWGELGRGPGQFDNPVGVALDSQGAVYVADLNNNRIQKFVFPSPLAPDEEEQTALNGIGGGHRPEVLDVVLPRQIEPNGLPIPGTVRFRDPDGDALRARFRVIDGKYDPFVAPIDAPRGRTGTGTETGTEGSIPFTVTCEIAQQVTLLVVVEDAQGLRSDPEGITFTCGVPPRGNYNREQDAVRPVGRTLGVNVFVLADGVTTLADGSSRGSGAAVGEPSPAVARAMRQQVIPAVTGIWDQCGVEFELLNLWVVDPRALRLAGGSLDELLFVREGELPEVALADPNRRRPLAVLHEAVSALRRELAARGGELPAESLTVFVSGARIVMRPGDKRHFGGVTTIGGRVSLVRWDAIWVIDETTGAIFPPKRPITAFAHEFGHNFGLEHLSLEDDPLNLMLSVPQQPTAVPPEPTVNLLPEQCAEALPAIRELDLRGRN